MDDELDGRGVMGWQKVDDGLHSHRKTRAVRRSHPTKSRDVAPFGLWVLAGSWCGANSTTLGFVPLEVLEDFDDDAQELAGRLVAAGLWRPAERDGETGFQFHDWEDYNPLEAAESGAVGNHIRWHVKKGVINPECTYCGAIVDDDSSPRLAPDDRPDSGTTPKGSSPPSRLPDPTRPDPTRPDPTDIARSARSARPGFDDFWELYPRKVSKGAAAKAWKAATKKAPAEVIITGLRDRLPSIAMERRLDGDYRKHPATWLNQECWTDEIEPVRSEASSAWDRATVVRAGGDR